MMAMGSGFSHLQHKKTRALEPEDYPESNEYILQ